MNTLFLQFYHKRKTSINKELICFNNGFSDTWDLCKKYGDFYWLEYKINDDYFVDIDFDTELPISKGRIFVSCFYITQLWWIVNLARKYPEIEFIVGGPVNGFIPEKPLPKNMIMINLSVESYFNKPDFSYKWKLELPEVDNDSILHFTYPIDDRCYWSKCIFCTYPTKECRIRKELYFEFQYVNPGQKKLVFIYAPSISPFYITMIPDQPNQQGIEYLYFIRSDISGILKSVLSTMDRTNNQIFACGMDFPSNRMLKFINKGLTKEHYIKLAERLNQFDCTLLFTMILGWPNLVENDVKETEDFIKKLKEVNPNVVFKVNKLISKPEKMLNKFKIGNKYKIGDFYCGFYPYLNKKQQDLNNRILEKVKEFGNVSDYYSDMVRKAL